MRSILIQTRDNHPSFVLLRKDGIDRRLFPNAAELKQFESKGRTEENGPVSPVWDIIRGSWPDDAHHNIVIEGAGGIGKTVTLFSVTNITECAMPPAVYVPMHRLVDEDGSCIDLTTYIEKIHKGITDLVKGGWTGAPKLLVLLDGFNEVPGNKRRTILHMVNDWHTNNPGAQLIAVSRPMDGMNLKAELNGNPIPITLEPLSRETVREYLGDKTPPESSPVWNVLTRPLFLNLYIKSDKHEGRKSDGYPLSPKPSESGGALIWNYLQRELLKQDSEQWVLRCALACEYILPYIAYRMEREHRFTIERKQAMTYINDALNSIDPERLPRHLADIFDEFDNRHFDYPDLAQFDWKNTVFNDVGLLKADKKSHSFIHQNFRDALAGLYLVNQAEMMADELPEVWRRTANHYVMDYAAELMDEQEADKLWEANRKLRPTDSAATYAMMELQSRRFDGNDSKLDFSGMDLRGISLLRYCGHGNTDMKLFEDSNLSRKAILDENVFRDQGHIDTLKCVTILPDGNCVSGALDRTLRIWDMNTGECLLTMDGHTESVWCVSATRDGKCISGSGDGALRVWDTSTGVCLQELEGHTDSVRCLAVSKDGYFVSGSADGTIRVWDTHSWKCLRVLRGHSGGVKCIALTADDNCISGSYDKTIRVWDIHTGECKHIINAHAALIRCLAVSGEGKCISGSDDKTLKVWDVNTWECLHTLRGHTRSVTCLEATDDGRCVSGSADNSLRVWDIINGKCIRSISGHTSWVECLTMTNNNICVSGSADRTLRVWNINSGECIQIMDGHKNWVYYVALTNDNKCISGSWDNALQVFDIDSGECICSLQGHTGWIECIAVTESGKCISGSRDKTLRLWDITRGECLLKMEGHADWVRCVDTTNDRICVSGSDDCTVRVWDIKSGKCLHVMQGHNDTVTCIAVSNKGICVSGSLDNSLRVWDINTGKLKCTMEGHSASIYGVVLTSNKKCVSASNDGTIRLWNIDSGKCLDVLYPIAVDVSKMDFSEAELSSILAISLVQNGAKISGADYDA